MKNSPWQIPDVKTASGRSMDGAGEFGQGAPFPRTWGTGQWKLFKRSMDGGAKKLKAHEYLVMLRSGLLAILASWPRDGSEPNPFAPLIGRLTTIIRELTSHELFMKVSCYFIINPRVPLLC